MRLLISSSLRHASRPVCRAVLCLTALENVTAPDEDDAPTVAANSRTPPVGLGRSRALRSRPSPLQLPATDPQLRELRLTQRDFDPRRPPMRSRRLSLCGTLRACPWQRRACKVLVCVDIFREVAFRDERLRSVFGASGTEMFGATPFSASADGTMSFGSVR